MAQDVRPYKSKEQDGQGNEIILRDQQLVEQTSQTTMASGEYFEIVDVDGRMAKIPKDNMIGVVREALGTMLNGLADQTTVAKFLTLNGNTLGASAAATAASVLGVGNITNSGTVSEEVDLDTYSNKSFYGIFTNAQNRPSVNRCYVCQIGDKLQFGFDFYTGTLKSRIKNSNGWQAWS